MASVLKISLALLLPLVAHANIEYATTHEMEEFAKFTEPVDLAGFTNDSCSASGTEDNVVCQMNSTSFGNCQRQCHRNVHRCQTAKYSANSNKCTVYLDNTTRGCDNLGVTNLRQYTRRYADGRSSGESWGVTYTKLYDFTGLRVRFAGNLRVSSGVNNHAARFYVKFNGQECSNPATIEYVGKNDGNRRDELKHDEFEGICEGLAAGSINIGIYTGNVPGYSVSGAHIGWDTANRILVEEVDTRPVQAPCALLSLYNVKQYVFPSFTHEQDNGVIPGLDVSYEKVASDSALRVKWFGVLRGYQGNYCRRWFFTFNGVECTSPFPLDGAVGFLHGNDASPQYMFRTIEGICEGLGKGPYTIQFNVGACPTSSFSHHNAYTGFSNTVSRIIVEEVRLGRGENQVILNEGYKLTNSVFNVHHWNWYAVDSTDNNAEIKRFNYIKMSSSTILRVTFNGVIRPATSRGHCARWFFKFNNNLCSNPATIEGEWYENSSDYAELDKRVPTSVSGMCKGLNAGSVLVTFSIGQCNSGHGLHSTYTGWMTRMTIIVEEVHAEA
ncbi:uncharacterized protein LOC106165774 [Lingula anatina]|uniref:Uncharacterized protein LOC106165774 n=1 Tax=Lingula anatina TaxID=7574 RepID=A0A1S3IPX5_LINAN|nr:uncharacterized protein LOC106165774 [Lingula anatina]|eukprot:XP_013399589.1 uncharacterized protein LOC106165774 [Lingula anatina]